MADETYAILREPGATVDVDKVAEVLAPLNGMHIYDVKKTLQHAPGILGLIGKADAHKALALLRARGTEAFLVPTSKLITPPSLVELRHGKITGDGFAFAVKERHILAPWEQIILIDSARVLMEEQVKVSEVQVPETVGRDGRTSYRVTRKTRTRSTWREFLDVLCYKPWVHFRIRKESFGFAGTGLPVHPTRDENFLALAVIFKTRCQNAVEGPGIEPLFDAKPETRRSFSNMKACDNHFLWQVQLRFRKRKGAG